MGKDRRIAARIDGDLAERLDAIRARMAEGAQLGEQLSESVVVRELLQRGAAVAEIELGIVPDVSGRGRHAVRPATAKPRRAGR